MKKKYLRNWIVTEYLKLIKHDEPLKHDLICNLLDIPIIGKQTIRSSLPEQTWRINVWKSIVTAPKDETRLILSKWVGHVDNPTALWWITRGYWSPRFKNWTDGIDEIAEPTHWILQSDLPKP